MPEEIKPEGNEPAGDDKSLDEKINIAVSAHLKRAMKGATADLSKTLGEQIAKALEGFKPPEPAAPEPAAGEKGKEDPKLKLALEEIEKLKRTAAEERAARTAVEEKARKDAMRSAAMAALDAKGVKGAKARAIVAAWELEGRLRFNEQGQPALEVSRSRQKGARPEALEWDITEGVEDWCKTPEAEEFLPAPSGSANPRAPYGDTTPLARRGTPKKYDTPPRTPEEAVRRTEERLRAAGWDGDIPDR